MFVDDSLENVESKPSISSAKPSKRMHVAMELLQTETNYNSILHILLNVSALLYIMLLICYNVIVVDHMLA